METKALTEQINRLADLQDAQSLARLARDLVADVYCLQEALQRTREEAELLFGQQAAENNRLNRMEFSLSKALSDAGDACHFTRCVEEKYEVILKRLERLEASRQGVVP